MVLALAFMLGGAARAADHEQHDHPAPERLGAVTFATTCDRTVQTEFNRGVALLHSFAYAASADTFRDVATRDPRCAMALWGVAMTRYHQLWEPPSGEDLRLGAAEIRRAANAPAGSRRESDFIGALEQYYAGWESAPPAIRAERYAAAMARVARDNPRDDEARIFYALALIATASPADRTHARQKLAADILEPIRRRLPRHPGVTHYLIHAYDSAELAPRGLAAAKAYSQIAPSAPHALHMPSHIFTRLGLWDDSIASNQAARAAAHAQHDVGEELHAMDYLTYAYLQRGRYQEAKRVVEAAGSMAYFPATQFKVAYPTTAMSVRLAVEQGDWRAAARLPPPAGPPPRVAAIVYWARALGHSRARPASPADTDIAGLRACLDAVRASGDVYWTAQVDAMLKSARAWALAAGGERTAAVSSLRAAADEEDGLEKLPVTPGPIVPAREQLGELLLSLDRPDQALTEFNTALAFAPRRRGALLGAIAAAEHLGDSQTAGKLRALLTSSPS